jgi:hypothetical protein
MTMTEEILASFVPYTPAADLKRASTSSDFVTSVCMAMAFPPLS